MGAVLRGESLSLTTLPRVVVVRWFAAPSVLDVQLMRRASEALGREHSRGIAHMNVIDVPLGQAQRPTEEARQAMISMLRDRQTPLRASSVIFPHDGFQAAVMRSILGGLLLLSRTTAVVRVHRSADQGAEWISSMLSSGSEDPAPTVNELLGALRTLA
jgi:hypothetical protein